MIGYTIFRYSTCILRKYSSILGKGLFAFSLYAFSFLAPSYAETSIIPSWKHILGSHIAMPKQLVTVDKEKQQLFVYTQKKRYTLAKQFVCTTGSRLGDKQLQGDLKTPEGIYFVEKHLSSGLDYTRYGYEAFTLNYPNPVDKLRGKTGYGIWIHGRGELISPLITQGCVALNNDDLALLRPFLESGTPVSLTSSVVQTPKMLAEDLEASKALVVEVNKWAQAWANRSPQFFSFYDEASYSKAQGEPFQRFRKQKESIFKRFSWIKIELSNIQILKGPGYWVSWFHQDYQAPNVTTQGVRRLYWQQDERGVFKIIGMEWLPGLSTGSSVADAEPATSVGENEYTSEEQAIPLSEEANIILGEKNAAALKADAAYVSQVKMAEDTEISKPILAMELFASINGTDSQEKAVEVAVREDRKSPKSNKTAPLREQKTEVPVKVLASADGNLALNLPKPLESQNLNNSTVSINTESLTKERADAPSIKTNEPVLVVASKEEVVSTSPSTPPSSSSSSSSSAPVIVETASSPEAAVATATPASVEAEAIVRNEKKEGPPQYLFVSGDQSKKQEAIASAQHANRAQRELTQKKAESLGEPLSEQERLLVSVNEAIEEWREAWELGDLDWYCEFYLDSSKQGSRKGIKAIKEHKKALWAKNPPKKVRLSDMQIDISPQDIQVSMLQEYEDKSGKGDKGIKTIHFIRQGNMLFILNEEWRAAN